MMEKESREMRVMINKAGGNAGQKALNYRISIPSAWANKLGITENSRNVLVTFDGKNITMQRPND